MNAKFHRKRSIFANNMLAQRFIKSLSLYKCITLLFGGYLLISCFSCSNKSPSEKRQEMYDKKWAQTQLDNILSPYLHMDWDTASLKITFNDVVPPVIEEYGTCREYGSKQLKVYSVWSMSFDDMKDAYPISLYVRHGDITVLSKAHDGSITIELDSMEFENAVKKYRQDQQEKAEEKRAALRESKNAVDLANRNKTKVHFGMSELDYYAAEKIFQKNFIDGLIGKGAYELSKPIFGKGKFVGFEIHSKHGRSCGHENVINNAKIVRDHPSQVNRFHNTETDYVSSLYNLRIYASTNGASGEYSESITVWWNSYIKRYN